MQAPALGRAFLGICSSSPPSPCSLGRLQPCHTPRSCCRVKPAPFGGSAFPSYLAISYPRDAPLCASRAAPSTQKSLQLPPCTVIPEMQNRQRVTKNNKKIKTKKQPSKTVAVSEGGSVSSALLVMVNCCTQAPILKQESLCQKVHVLLENRWCGSELIRSGCPAAFVCCQKSQAKLLLLFHSHLQQGRSRAAQILLLRKRCRSQAASSSRELRLGQLSPVV